MGPPTRFARAFGDGVPLYDCRMSSRRTFEGVRAKWMGQFKKPSFKAKRSAGAGKGFVARPGMGRSAGGTERKVIDLAEATYACDTTGSVTLLDGVATGTDYTDRIGRKIMLKSVQVRGVIGPQDQTVVDHLARVMVVYDKQPTGAAPALATILNAATATSFMNLSSRDRFVVIFDQIVPVAVVSNVATQSLAGSPTTHLVNQYKSLNHEVIFGTTGGTIAGIQSGALWLVTCGSQAATGGSNAVLSCRVRFLDQ